MEKFDDNQAAKEAIASSPEITQSVVETEEVNASQAVESVYQDCGDILPSHEDQRNARLLSGCIKGVLKAVGGEVNPDQLDATQELSAEGFSALSGLNPPRWLRISIILSLLVGSFAPVGVAFFQSMKAINNDDD